MDVEAKVELLHVTREYCYAMTTDFPQRKVSLLVISYARAMGGRTIRVRVHSIFETWRIKSVCGCIVSQSFPLWIFMIYVMWKWWSWCQNKMNFSWNILWKICIWENENCGKWWKKDVKANVWHWNEVYDDGIASEEKEK